MRRIASILLFLELVNESSSLYGDYMFAPFAWVRSVLVAPLVGIRPFDLLLIGILLYGVMQRSARVPSVRPMRRTLLVAAGITGTYLLYGLARGGDARAAGWQVYLPLSMVLATFAFASVCRKAEHFSALWNATLAAGVCHAVMAILFNFLYLRPGRIQPFPEYASLHDDTVLWTSGICLLLMRYIHVPTRRNGLLAGVLVPILLAAIQFNRRRLAWISLGGALLTLYFLLPASAAKRRVNRVAAVIVPVLALYALVGWGRTEGIFRPLMAFQTVSTAEDASTKARIVEDLGLVATAHQATIVGNGWGHKYLEISAKYRISEFELWPYVPHNSVLGLLAYTGYLGFLGYWMVFPAGVFFHARLARAPRPNDRLVGLVGMAQLVVCADQWYGDMGSFSSITMYTLAVSMAAAMRVPALAGVWPPAGTAPAGRVA
jgi:hypothetical protein